ncbi:hypothetical protein [Vibrio sp. WXL210]|uniref:hypothetical protein n=1 Tax=Vibrio sp. WXL210 TaxID=3450709 RepID=UPI003EC7C1FB
MKKLLTAIIGVVAIGAAVSQTPQADNLRNGLPWSTQQMTCKVYDEDTGFYGCISKPLSIYGFKISLEDEHITVGISDDYLKGKETISVDEKLCDVKGVGISYKCVNFIEDRMKANGYVTIDGVSYKSPLPHLKQLFAEKEIL